MELNFREKLARLIRRHSPVLAVFLTPLLHCSDPVSLSATIGIGGCLGIERLLRGGWQPRKRSPRGWIQPLLTTLARHLALQLTDDSVGCLQPVELRVAHARYHLWGEGDDMSV